jgi:hypothetical protein
MLMLLMLTMTLSVLCAGSAPATTLQASLGPVRDVLQRSLACGDGASAASLLPLLEAAHSGGGVSWSNDSIVLALMAHVAASRPAGTGSAAHTHDGGHPHDGAVCDAAADTASVRAAVALLHRARSLQLPLSAAAVNGVLDMLHDVAAGTAAPDSDDAAFAFDTALSISDELTRGTVPLAHDASTASRLIAIASKCKHLRTRETLLASLSGVAASSF